jgi:hypothetical protein
VLEVADAPDGEVAAELEADGDANGKEDDGNSKHVPNGTSPLVS